MKSARSGHRSLVCAVTLFAALVLARSLHAGQARSVRDGVFSAAQAERGLTLYRGECGRCHAEALLGSESGPALVGEAFLNGWRQREVAELFELIRLTMPQDAPGHLTGAQTADIVAYILRGNDFPAGDRELPADIAQLRTIQFGPKEARR